MRSISQNHAAQIVDHSNSSGKSFVSNLLSLGEPGRAEHNVICATTIAGKNWLVELPQNPKTQSKDRRGEIRFANSPFTIVVIG